MNSPATQTTRSILVLLVLASCVCLWPARVRAGNGPFNGKIAFSSHRDGHFQIYTMNPDGTNQVNISNNSANDESPSWSPDGTKIAFHSTRDGNFEIYVMNADGTNQTRLTFEPGNDADPSWSPDGTKITFRSQQPNVGDAEIYVMNADGTGQTPLTNNSAQDDDPVWSPDGTKIAFVSTRDGGFEIYVMNFDGTSQTRLTNNTTSDVAPAFSPDGTKIIFQRVVTGSQIFIMNSNGSSQTQLTSSAGNNSTPAFSPDGTQIIFASTRDINQEIYTMNAVGSNQIRVTNNPATDKTPAWQPIPKTDTIGVFRPSTGQFLLRNFNSSGPANITISFGQGGDQPLAGDWNGDGVDDVGVFRNGQFFLRQPRAIVNPIVVKFGQSGDLAVVGDWNGDDIDTPGVFRPSTGQFLLTNSPNINNSSPSGGIITFAGQSGDKPVAGDWNGDGLDTVGIYRGSAACSFILSNNNFSTAIIASNYCDAGPVSPIVGDWNGNGVDTIGIHRLTFATFSLSNSNTSLVGQAELQFNFGQAGDLPVAGDWNGGNTAPDSGVNDPSSGSSAVGQTQIFTTTCSDPDGWHNISTIDFKIAKSLGPGNGVAISLWVQFDENLNVIRFYDPDLGTWSEGVPGSNVVLSSRFADLNLAGTHIQSSGPTGSSVQITWEVVFKLDAVKNNYRQYLQITDDAGLSTGFDKVGSWRVTNP